MDYLGILRRWIPVAGFSKDKNCDYAPSSITCIDVGWLICAAINTLYCGAGRGDIIESSMRIIAELNAASQPSFRIRYSHCI